MARNTGEGKRIGIIGNRYQKKNAVTGRWDKYDTSGNYLSTKETGGRFKSIIALVGRNPRRP